MNNSEPKENQKREIIYQICDKNTCEALDRLTLVNEKKGSIMQNKLIEYFKANNKIIDYEVYKKLVAGINNNISVSFKHRSSYYDLNDIEDSG